MSVLSQSVAREALVSPRARAGARWGATGAGEHADVGVGLVDNLYFAGATERHLPVALGPPEMMELSFLFISLVEVQGVLGWDVLRSYDVTLDYARAILTLQPAMPCVG